MEIFVDRCKSNSAELQQQDLKLIDEYLIEILKISEVTTKDIYLWKLFLLSIKQTLVSNRMPQNKLRMIQKVAIAKRGLESLDGNLLDDIIWWTELRAIQDQKELISFLELQKLHLKQSAVIGVLIESGRDEEVKNWFSHKNIKHFDTILELTTKRKNILFSLDNNVDNLTEILTTEIKQIIFELFPVIGNKNSNILYFQYLDWLFLQISINKSNDKIQSILDKLNDDWLDFNENIVPALPQKNRIGIVSIARSSLKIDWKVQYILNPNTDKKAWTRQQFRKYINHNSKN